MLAVVHDVPGRLVPRADRAVDHARVALPQLVPGGKPERDQPCAVALVSHMMPLAVRVYRTASDDHQVVDLTDVPGYVLHYSIMLYTGNIPCGTGRKATSKLPETSIQGQPHFLTSC